MGKIGCSACGQEYGKNPGCRCTDTTDRFAGYIFFAFGMICMVGVLVVAYQVFR